MAVVSATNSVSNTLTASTVDTAVLYAPCIKVTVTNVTGTSAIYFTVGPTSGQNLQPTVGGTNCYVLPAAIGSIDVKVVSSVGVVVNLISAGTPGYNVAIAGSSQ